MAATSGRAAGAVGQEPTRRAEREREILDAAVRLFREQGYASTTIRDIGAAAGLNHALSHYYFGSKAAILFTVYQEAIDGFLDRMDAIPDGPPAQVLAEVVRVAVTESARRPDHTAVFFQERRWLEVHLPAEQCAALRARQVRFRARVAEVVAAGTAAGDFREIDPMVVVETVVGIATWAYQSAGAPENGTEQCVAFVLGGLLTGGGGLLTGGEGA